MTSRKAIERWETKVGNCDVTPEVLWTTAKSLMKRYGPKAPKVIHGPLGIVYTYNPKKKTNVIADCLENRFTSHDLHDETHEREVETTVQALVASVDDTPVRKVKVKLSLC
jgi:hypothetical protein